MTPVSKDYATVGSYAISVRSRAYNADTFDDVAVAVGDDEVIAQGDFEQVTRQIREHILDLAGVLSALERMARQ